MRHSSESITAVLGFAMLTCWSAAPAARAQDVPAPAPSAQQAEAQRINDLAALLDAQNKLLELQNARFKAQIESLGLPAIEGKTTLGSDAGRIESWMLASGTLTAAATEIDRIAGSRHAGSIVLLGGDDVLDLNKGPVLQREIDALLAAYASASSCAGPSLAPAAVPPLAAVGAVLSLLRTDTEISGMTVEGAEGALLNAIAGTTPGRYVIPSDIARSRSTGSTVDKLAALLEARSAVPACRASIISAARSADDKKRAADAITTLDVVAARIDTYLTAIATRSQNKPSDLEVAMLGDTIEAAHPGFRVLRVKLDKAGGTLLKRSNLFTTLGAPAVGITGGAVVSWRLTDPLTGTSGGGGVLVCRTSLTNLNAIHAGRVGKSACGSEVTVPKAMRSARGY